MTNGEHHREIESGPLRPTRRRDAARFQTGLRGLIVAVACCGLIAWAGRSLWEGRHPAIAAARGLDSREPSARARATRELMSTGVTDPGRAIPPLIAALADPAAEVRVGAAVALGVIASHLIPNGSLGDAPRIATEGMIRALGDREPSVRVAVIEGLERIAGTPGADAAVDLPAVVGAFAATLGDRDEDVRLLALTAIKRCSALRPAEPSAAIGAALEDRSARIRAAAATALGYFQRPLDPWLPSLLRGLGGGEHEVRLACWGVLYRGKPGFSAAAIPALVAALKSRDRDVRIGVASALEPHSRDPRVAAVLFPALLELLRAPIEPTSVGHIGSGSSYLQILSARMLGRVAPGTTSAGEVVAALAEVARSGDPHSIDLRASAIDALGEFGPAAEPAVPALLEAFRDARVIKSLRPNRARIARVLGRIAPGTMSAGAAIAALNDALDIRSRRREDQSAIHEMHLAAIEALPAFGAAAASALPRLRAWQASADPRIKTDKESVDKALAAIEGAGSGERDPSRSR